MNSTHHCEKRVIKILASIQTGIEHGVLGKVGQGCTKVQLCLSVFISFTTVRSRMLSRFCSMHGSMQFVNLLLPW